ncbi:hypothetical protein ACO2Q3_24035 [Caulobacter sp. KR2-114]|uniref:hypothetical protein n=1 Tax=Caulobacter sp. KR2-114 TaxID=3400912 RepID=UPI003C10172E
MNQSAFLCAAAVVAFAGLDAATARAESRIWPDWRTIDQRQATDQARIDAGVRDGSLTRAEAVRLRGEYRDIARLEAQYRRHGMSRLERAQLDRRLDRLGRQIAANRHDAQTASNGAGVNGRMAEMNARIAAGAGDGSLTVSEAARLRGEMAQVWRIEARYRMDGLSAAERSDLNRRLDYVSADIRNQRSDLQRRW